MPIVIKDFKWKQTPQNVTIQAPIRKVQPTKADIFISSRYVKVTFEKYFFEVLLFDKIVTDHSKCTVTDDEVIFELEKEEQKQWPLVEPDLTKKDKLELKKQVLEEAYKDVQKRAEELAGKKSELKRLAVQKQIETDTSVRNKIECIKKHEEKNALGDLEEWRKNVEKFRAKQKSSKHARKAEIKNQKGKVEKKIEAKVEEPVPLRSSRTLEVDFTTREFPTPCRESLLEEENQWLAKQAEARRSAGFVSEDIRPEERNPQFIQAKGDEFMKNRNYLGAISAYTYGIKISKNFVDFYIRRAEAHMAVGNMNKVVRDCSSAMELLQPAVPSNQLQRALCTGRRGVALCRLGMLRQGIDELVYSLKLMPNAEFMEALDNARKDYEVQKNEERKAEEKKAAERSRVKGDGTGSDVDEGKEVEEQKAEEKEESERNRVESDGTGSNVDKGKEVEEKKAEEKEESEWNGVEFMEALDNSRKDNEVQKNEERKAEEKEASKRIIVENDGIDRDVNEEKEVEEKEASERNRVENEEGSGDADEENEMEGKKAEKKEESKRNGVEFMEALDNFRKDYEVRKNEERISEEKEASKRSRVENDGSGSNVNEENKVEGKEAYERSRVENEETGSEVDKEKEVEEMKADEKEQSEGNGVEFMKALDNARKDYEVQKNEETKTEEKEASKISSRVENDGIGSDVNEEKEEQERKAEEPSG
ncbi:unnamed protein product [Callosobruchus maculatus]|uniref:CS domain-containing protein n=1 Tax=Callosobruchus maculatus TaxID=64391 RepID=A0A653CMU3_CALMS|nr:unnamed protein product [Callosobruchus maculatus]